MKIQLFNIVVFEAPFCITSFSNAQNKKFESQEFIKDKNVMNCMIKKHMKIIANYV